MNEIDGRVLDLAEIEAMSTPELIAAALLWVGHMRVEANTYSAVCKQATCDVLLTLNARMSIQP